MACVESRPGESRRRRMGVGMGRNGQVVSMPMIMTMASGGDISGINWRGEQRRRRKPEKVALLG